MNPILPSHPIAAVSLLRRLALVFGLLTALTASAGQNKLAASIRSARDEVIATRDQLQVTVNALDALVKQKEGALKPSYDAFVQEVARTHANAALTTNRAATMGREASAHFGEWQQEIDGVSNKSLRKKGQKRFDSVQGSYNKAVAALTKAGTSFGPYLSDLDDIRKILDNDLTPGGLKSIRNTVGTAKFDLITVRKHLTETVSVLDKMQKSLTPTAGGS